MSVSFKRLALAVGCALFVIQDASATSITARKVSPASPDTVTTTIAASATVNQVLKLTVTDGVAATTTTGCTGGANVSNFTGGGGTANGTLNFGTYDIDFGAAGATPPTNAMGCPTATGSFAVTTFTVGFIATQNATVLKASRNAGSTWNQIRVAKNDTNDWTNDSTGDLVGTSATAITGLDTIAAGKSSAKLQVGWKVNYGDADGAKSGTLTLDLVSP